MKGATTSKAPKERTHPAGLDRAVARKRARERRWREEGERPPARNLALIGALGWLVVLPMLAGIFVGRWLDRSLDSGITLTAGLMLLGLVAGCRMAWQRMHRE